MSETYFEVTISEMTAAADKVASENQNLRDSVTRMIQAADALGEGWTGAANDDFKNIMTERKAWFEKMASLVDEYVAALKATAERYQAADSSAVQAIRKF